MLFPVSLEGWVRKVLSASAHQDMLILSSLLLCCWAILTLLLMLHECLTAVSSPHNSYITGGSSLLFSFEARLQSWLMFAQKYVIADFLLINRSRAGCHPSMLLLSVCLQARAGCALAFESIDNPFLAGKALNAFDCCSCY